MNENTFLNLGNNNQASQPMDMNPMGGDASSMPMGDPNMMGGDPNTMGGAPDPMAGGDPNAMGDPNMMDDGQNAPVMGADAFDDEGDADVSGDPEKKAESLAGQLASIFRNDLPNNGIDKHEDKKKEVLGMIASAIVDGMSPEDRNSMVEYLSDKLNGSGESDGDESNDDEGNQDMGGENQDIQEPDLMMGGDPNAMDDPSQQMMESKVNEIVSNIIKEMTGNDLTRKKEKPKAKVDQEEKKGYKSNPYMVKK